MARTKPPSVVRRTPSELHAQSNGVIYRDGYSEKQDQKQTNESIRATSFSDSGIKNTLNRQGIVSLIVCVGGIYASL
jgi:hypothetical protein